MSSQELPAGGILRQPSVRTFSSMRVVFHVRHLADPCCSYLFANSRARESQCYSIWLSIWLAHLVPQLSRGVGQIRGNGVTR